MKALFLTKVSGERKARALLAIRSILHELGNGPASPAAAEAVYQRVAVGQPAMLGLLENITPERLDVFRAPLTTAYCETEIGDYEVETDEEEPEPEEDEFVLSTSRDIAILILGHCGGQPVQACGVLAGLYRLTEDAAFADAIEVIANIFPWTKNEIAMVVKGVG